MYWVIFAAISWGVTIFIIKNKQDIKNLWPAGLVAVLVVYLVDSTGTHLGAYSFHNSPLIYGVPILYLVAAFPLGMITMYLYPNDNRKQLAYVIIMAGLFLIPEIVMLSTGYFQHSSKWSVAKSYFLNLFGFIIIIWSSTKLGVKVQNENLYHRILR